MRLTKEQIEARMTMYEECIGHLDMDVTDDPEEMIQAKIVQKQFRRIADNFYKKHG